jgi:hypothetical protein
MRGATKNERSNKDHVYKKNYRITDSGYDARWLCIHILGNA